MSKTMNKAAASRIQSSAAKANHGKIAKNSFPSRAQAAANKSTTATQKSK
ncbi:hypothetical protein DFR27_0663 [Umboniibacter marinipuniceus]|uniref:SMP domain-containing protein n=1 Tax=Umboniibacter marinipuniceus TaxID=569599 RepID=A0A3M0ADU4_9GAMM|nr:hypothetical protein DFR27_0663 [Umboniibacter marinipuniceus]